MFDNIKPVSLHCVFHGIRFKVNEDWVSGIDTLLFFIPLFLYEYPSRLNGTIPIEFLLTRYIFKK